MGAIPKEFSLAFINAGKSFYMVLITSLAFCEVANNVFEGWNHLRIQTSKSEGSTLNGGLSSNVLL